MIGVVFVAGMLAFRSVLAGLYLIAPLLVTVLVNFGVMGLTGIPLNTPNSVSSAMAIGIGADYAIYLLFRMREECERLGDFDQALRETMRTAGQAVVYVASAIAGQAVWESVNPVSITQRALIFGGTLAWGAVAAVFLFDLLVAPRGWCGHLCPVGAAYALIGSASLLRVSAAHSSRCNDCADCFAVCPEPQVIVLPLKGKGGAGPVITDRECSNCGRCIDVCAPDVFRFTQRFDPRRD